MQGFNMGRYRPPSTLDSALSTDPAAKQSHPLGARARKLPQGILTVRFEMPFAIWCSTCPAHSSNTLIGQGVRFNAEKRRVGNYFSTPVWAFRMKHTACGGWVEMRTDPKNSEYVVAEGARRRDYGDSQVVAARVGGVMIGVDEGEAERKRRDAFAALEGKVEDKVRAKGEAARLEELRSLKERDWRDVDAANRRLRAEFRVGRSEREKEEKVRGALMDKMSLGIEILAETEEDARRAALVEFGIADAVGDADATALAATRKPLFAANEGKAGIKTEMVVAARKLTLQKELFNNTRAVVDPFAVHGAQLAPLMATNRAIPGVKRKRQDLDITDKTTERTGDEAAPTEGTFHSDTDNASETLSTTTKNDDMMHQKGRPTLVQYDSD